MWISFVSHTQTIKIAELVRVIIFGTIVPTKIEKPQAEWADENPFYADKSGMSFRFPEMSDFDCG